MFHPRRWTAWNMRISHPWKEEKSSEPNHHFQVLCVNLPGCHFPKLYSFLPKLEPGEPWDKNAARSSGGRHACGFGFSARARFGFYIILKKCNKMMWWVLPFLKLTYRPSKWMVAIHPNWVQILTYLSTYSPQSTPIPAPIVLLCFVAIPICLSYFTKFILITCSCVILLLPSVITYRYSLLPSLCCFFSIPFPNPTNQQ